MEPSSKNKTKSSAKKCGLAIKSIFNRGLKNLFSCFSLSVVIVCLFVLIVGARPLLKSLEKDFSFFSAIMMDKVPASDLFVGSVKNFQGDGPEMSFVQGNSLISVSAPTTMNPKVLGSVISEDDDLSELENLGDSRELIEYTVKEGDTLSYIAEKYDISLSTMLWANNLSSTTKIKPGQILLVLPISGAVHLVGDGDTIGSIAKKYKGEIEEIVSFNELSGEGDIYIGDMLIIPGGKMPRVATKVASIPLANTYFIFPVEGKITQGAHGALGNAVDVANKCGKPIVAAAGGTVQRTGPAPISGNIVTILHPNKVVTFYGHLSTITVSPGESVGQGEIIGYVGNTGYTVGATGCHLHFEVRGGSNFLAGYNIGKNLSW